MSYRINNHLFSSLLKRANFDPEVLDGKYAFGWTKQRFYNLLGKLERGEAIYLKPRALFDLCLYLGVDPGYGIAVRDKLWFACLGYVLALNGLTTEIEQQATAAAKSVDDLALKRIDQTLKCYGITYRNGCLSILTSSVADYMRRAYGKAE